LKDVRSTLILLKCVFLFSLSYEIEHILWMYSFNLHQIFWTKKTFQTHILTLISRLKIVLLTLVFVSFWVIIFSSETVTPRKIYFLFIRMFYSLWSLSMQSTILLMKKLTRNKKIDDWIVSQKIQEQSTILYKHRLK
jgi:hypothetical protein